MFKGIPRTALPHSATLIQAGSVDAWTAAAATETPLVFVRITGGQSLSYHENGASAPCNKLLFFDCANSLPRGTLFAVGDKIRQGTETYTVKVVNAVGTDRRNLPIHHWELGLV